MPFALWFPVLGCSPLCFLHRIALWICSCCLLGFLDLSPIATSAWTSATFGQPSGPCFHFTPSRLSCMSREEFLELSAKVDQLADQVAILTQAVAQLSVAREPASPAASSCSALSSVPIAEASRSGASYSSSHDYNRLASLIPPCPESAIQLCSTLRGPWSFVDRAKRAWEIGYWARFCLEGRLEKPRPSTPLALQNTCYLVLRAEGFETPLLCHRASDYRSVVKDFKGPTISHGFPSTSEGKVYCLAAGVSYPSAVYQWRPQP